MEPETRGASGGGGPAPFLLKTYDMVDDASTDAIVSWSESKTSFVVWNPQEFARVLLPLFFKHNNFSSFIRQLNTYGFRKIDPEKWEFANEDFVKDQKHLLKNIHRRKPIHSHSNPQTSLVDPERVSLEEEIEKLTHEKNRLEASILGYEQQRSTAKIQLEDLTQRLDGLEQRQEPLRSFLEKAINNPSFVDRLARKIESMDFSAYNKKRRLPVTAHTDSIVGNSFIENHSSSRHESGRVMNQDFSRKLRLELSPSVSDINLLSHSAQSSNEDRVSPQRKISSGEPKEAQERSALLFPTDTLELSDTGTSYTFKQNPVFSRIVPMSESQLHAMQQNCFNEEVDGHISCHLNLTLASSPLQISKSSSTTKSPQSGQELRKSQEPRFNNISEESDMRISNAKNKNVGDNKATSKDATKNEAPAVAPARVNDVFWEQFLTERPGSSENKEASSNYSANVYEEQEDQKSNHGIPRNGGSLNQLSLWGLRN